MKESQLPSRLQASRLQVIYIPEAKAGPRELHINGQLTMFLTRYLSYLEKTSPGSEWLFPSISSKSGHTVEFKRVVAAADLDPREILIHTLRHTAITHLVQAGVDLSTVMNISGHKSFPTVLRYSHQDGKHVQAAMDILDKRLNIDEEEATG